MSDTIFHFAGGAGSTEADAWVESRAIDKSWTSVWEPCKILTQAGPLVNVRVTRTGIALHVDLRKTAVFPASPTVGSDISSLHYINEPCILHNLQTRAVEDRPYTFMGSVLVAVNPLKPIPDPEGALGTSIASRSPHPYAIAEGAYQQMSFAADSRRKTGKSADDVADQSIITSGESGSGKTESSKMVLRHLVSRTEVGAAATDIDRRLLQSNPITESFGNASTLRNPNSSRFGKFMTLNFAQLPTPNGTPAAWEITSGMVRTYLLERSRVTLHNQGERNYHVFYQLLSSASPSERQELGLDEPGKGGFEYLKSQQVAGAPTGGVRKTNEHADKKNHELLLDALQGVGLSHDDIKGVFSIISAILHLGNAQFVDKEAKEGDVATEAPPPSSNPAYEALSWAVDMLGLNKQEMLDFLIKRKVKINGEQMVVQRNSRATMFGRDAVAKGIYSALFDWLIVKINQSLAVRELPGEAAGPFIGVLDIFGFESFQFNGFEQLLINYTNESLQSVFNYSVFVAEADLYKKEGLVLEEELAPPPDNTDSMNLLNGTKNAGTGVQMAALGVLGIINAESQNPSPSDKKMVSLLHHTFDTTSKAFIRPHPKDADRTFIIQHYAGSVVYTSGSFIEKNNDQLPDGVHQIFANSSKPFVSNLFASQTPTQKRRSSRMQRKRNRPTVCSQFKTQISELVKDLGTTRNSFIRCVKPNAEMSRAGTWFNRAYVSSQLRCLSIPQTAEVLKSGLPTRVDYRTLVQSYSAALPKDAVDMWKRTGGAENMFVAALFFAFQIPRSDYRLGHTKVFFRSGKLAQLDQVFQAVDSWSKSNGGKKHKKHNKEGKSTDGPSQDEVVRRFKLYYVRAKWRRAYVIVMVTNHFRRISQKTQKRFEAVKKVVAFLRLAVAKKKVERMREEKSRKLQRELEERKREEEKKEREKQMQLASEQEKEEMRKADEQLESERKAQEESEQNATQDTKKGEVEKVLEQDRKEILKREKTVIQGVLDLKKTAMADENSGTDASSKQSTSSSAAERTKMMKQFSGISDLKTLTKMVSTSHFDLLGDSDSEVDEDDFVFQGDVLVVHDGQEEIMPADEAKHGKKGRKSRKKKHHHKKGHHHKHEDDGHSVEDPDEEPCDSDEEAQRTLLMFGVPVNPEEIEILQQEDVVYRIMSEAKLQEQVEYDAAVDKAAKHKKSKKKKVHIPTEKEREVRRGELEKEFAEKEIEYEASKQHVKIMRKLQHKEGKKKKGSKTTSTSKKGKKKTSKKAGGHKKKKKPAAASAAAASGDKEAASGDKEAASGDKEATSGDKEEHTTDSSSKDDEHHDEATTTNEDHQPAEEIDHHDDESSDGDSLRGEPAAVFGKGNRDTRLFHAGMSDVKPSLSFSSHASKRGTGKLEGSKGHKITDLFHHAHHFMISKAKEHAWFNRAIEDGKQVQQQADTHDGQLDSTRRLLTNANGNIKLVQANVVDAKELERPVKSANANVAMLKNLLDQGRITPDEFAKLTSQTAASIDRTFSHGKHGGGGLSRFLPSIHAKAAVYMLCPHCGADNNTVEGKTCKECGWKLVDEESDDEESHHSGKHHAAPPPVPKEGITKRKSKFGMFAARPPPVSKKDAKAAKAQSKEQQDKASKSTGTKSSGKRGMPSEFDDWGEELSFKDGVVRFRVNDAHEVIQSEDFAHVQVFTVSVQFQRSGDSVAINWVVVHDYHKFRNLEKGLKEGKAVSKVALKELGNFPTELSPTFPWKGTDEKARDMMHEWLVGVSKVLKANEGGSGRSSLRKMFRRTTKEGGGASVNQSAMSNPLVDTFFELKFHCAKKIA